MGRQVPRPIFIQSIAPSVLINGAHSNPEAHGVESSKTEHVQRSVEQSDSEQEEANGPFLAQHASRSQTTVERGNQRGKMRMILTQ